jgi:hypothetical protein
VDLVPSSPKTLKQQVQRTTQKLSSNLEISNRYLKTRIYSHQIDADAVILHQLCECHVLGNNLSTVPAKTYAANKQRETTERRKRNEHEEEEAEREREKAKILPIKR